MAAKCWNLNNEAANFVEIMDALTRTALSPRLWDRRENARDQIPAAAPLMTPLTGVGSLVEQLQTDPRWQRVTHKPDANGETLARALDGYCRLGPHPEGCARPPNSMVPTRTPVSGETTPGGSPSTS
jgi:hypothetical protein